LFVWGDRWVLLSEPSLDSRIPRFTDRVKPAGGQSISKNSVDFRAANSRTTQMLSRFYPNRLVLPGLLAVTGLRAVDAPVGGEAGVPITTQQASFTELKDPYVHNSWMVVEVDFAAKPTNSEKWINDVTVTLTMAWGSKGPPPQLDLSLSDSVSLIGVESNKRNAVFFFVPPEVLARNQNGPAYGASQTPTFYTIQYSVGGSPVTPGKADYSVQTLPDANYVKGFVGAASEKAEKGLLFTEATVPSYILNAELLHLSTTGINFPTYQFNAGH
jgi:hypothetical protein